ncbi:hypothetical protein [Niallia taxi]|uniref:hypothetical protein n=1 Tax=Niallia taxi TaxID=2499688 RepID=UPI0015F43B87|nr:hypothetical protein [Niallia taxi]
MEFYDQKKESEITEIYNEKLKMVQEESKLKGDYSNMDSLVDEVKRFHSFLEKYDKHELTELLHYVTFIEKVKMVTTRILTFGAILALALWLFTFLFGGQQANTLYLFILLVLFGGIYLMKYVIKVSLFRPSHELSFVRESLEFEVKKLDTKK